MHIDNSKKTRKHQLPFCGRFWNSCQEEMLYEHKCHLGMAVKISPDWNEDYCPYVVGSKYASSVYYIAYDPVMCSNANEWGWDRLQRYILDNELPIERHRVLIPFPVETCRGSGKYNKPKDVKKNLEHIWELGGTGYNGMPFLVYHIGSVPIRRLIGREVNARCIEDWVDNSWDKAQIMLGLADNATNIKPDKLWQLEQKARRDGTYKEPTAAKLERGRYARKEED